MDGLSKALKNVQTTIAGLGGGILIQLLTGSGIHWPQSGAQWQAFVTALIIAAVGILSKDGKTGSAPGTTE
jgi:predicted CDP-diglyceride synthetase/phosphatidate cytidylyltransferase